MKEVYIIDELELAEIEEQFEAGFWFKFKRIVKELLMIPYLRFYWKSTTATFRARIALIIERIKENPSGALTQTYSKFV